jgi:hypothetical protein
LRPVVPQRPLVGHRVLRVPVEREQCEGQKLHIYINFNTKTQIFKCSSHSHGVPGVRRFLNVVYLNVWNALRKKNYTKQQTTFWSCCFL